MGSSSFEGVLARWQRGLTSSIELGEALENGRQNWSAAHGGLHIFTRGVVGKAILHCHRLPSPARPLLRDYSLSLSILFSHGSSSRVLSILCNVAIPLTRKNRRRTWRKADGSHLICPASFPPSWTSCPSRSTADKEHRHLLTHLNSIHHKIPFLSSSSGRVMAPIHLLSMQT